MGDLVRWRRHHPEYPAKVEHCLREAAPPEITAAGFPALLQARAIAVFCSRSCPGDLASRTYDLAQKLRDAGATVAGGFHSPMEQECLRLLLRSPHPVILGLARGLEGLRRPVEYQRPLTEQRLLLLSPFPAGVKRVTTETARYRNRFVAALSDRVMVAHAAPGSGTETFCREILAWGKSLFTLDGDRNRALLDLGAIPLTPSRWSRLMD